MSRNPITTFPACNIRLTLLHIMLNLCVLFATAANETSYYNLSLSFSNSTSKTPHEILFIPPTKAIPLHLKYLIWITDNASIAHAGGFYPIRDILCDLANANKTLLPTYNISIEMYDTRYAVEYNVGTTVRLFMKYIGNEAFAQAENETDVCEAERRENDLGTVSTSSISDGCFSVLNKGHRATPLFLGPCYSAEAKVLAQIAPFYSLVQISDQAAAPDLSDKIKYPNFYRTILNSDAFVTLPRVLCNYFNISTVFLATLDDVYASDPMAKIDTDLRTYNITVLSKSTFLTRRNDTIDKMLDYLRLYDARIIIFWSDEYDEYRIFCRTLDYWAKINETFSPAKYLVIFMANDDGPTELEPDAIDLPGCSRAALATMMNGTLISLSPTWGPPTDRYDWGMSTAEFVAKAEELGRSRYGHPDGTMAPPLALAIDAIWLTFLTLDAVDRRLRAQTPVRTLLDFTFESSDIADMVREELVKTRFRGASGDVMFNSKGDVEGQIKIQQFRPLPSNHVVGPSSASARPSSFVDILWFFTANKSLVEIDGGKPLVFGTPTGQIPPDKASLAVLGTSSFYTALIVAVGCAVALVVCAVVISGYYVFKRKLLAASMNHPVWLIDFRTLAMRDLAAISRSSLFGQFSISSDGRSVDGIHSRCTAVLNEQVVRVQSVADAGRKLSINVHSYKFLTSFHDTLQHPNVVRWIGYCLLDLTDDGPARAATTSTSNHIRRKTSHNVAIRQYLLWEHCEKGSLEQLIENDSFNLDASFEYAIMLDVAQGMAFLHKCPTVRNVHGGLCAAACVIDKRFSVKVTNYGDKLLAGLFGLNSLQNDSNEEETDGGSQVPQTSLYSEKKLYWAPELLRSVTTTQNGKKSFQAQATTTTNTAATSSVNPLQAADIYAYAITMYVLLTRAPPYDSSGLTADEVLERVRDEAQSPPFRPETTLITTTTANTTQLVVMPNNIDKRLRALLHAAWSENLQNRPPFRDVVRQLQIISGVKSGSSVTDQLLQRLERYASDMELLVADRTQELEAEHRRADELLNSMLPAEIATELKRHGQVQPESFINVTIYFSDIVGFTSLSASSTPIQVVNLLNALYTVFDMQIDLFNAYKVETIGDAYMVVSGLPRPNGIQHAGEIGRLSLALLDVIRVFVIPHRPEEKLRLRIGMHTGPCVAGVVGVKMPRYCLFGDTVNTASRMESTGEPLRIHVSEAAKLALELVGGFELEEHAKLEIKGKGTMMTYWLNAFKKPSSTFPLPLCEQQQQQFGSQDSGLDAH